MRSRNRSVFIVGGLVAAGLAVLLIAVSQAGGGATEVTGVPQDGTSLGSRDAPVVIEEFSDFQCPYCRRAAFLLRPYLGQYRKQVRFVFVNFPLNRDCNPQVQAAVHGFACDAARYALCAADQGRFWTLHDLIFER